MVERRDAGVDVRRRGDRHRASAMHAFAAAGAFTAHVGVTDGSGNTPGPTSR